MATSEKLNTIEQQAADRNLIDGLTKNSQILSSFNLGGTSVQSSEIISALQARIAAANTVQSTRAAWQTAVKANANERASTKALILSVTQAVQLMYGGSIDKLAEFGLKPRKTRTALTPEQKLAAAAKAKATRAARHTMGSKQKKSVKGTVTAIVAPTSPTASSPTAPPAS